MDGHPGLARSRDCAAQWIHGGPENACPVRPPGTRTAVVAFRLSSRSFTRIEQPAMLENGIAIGHARNVVRHRARASRRALHQFQPRSRRLMRIRHQAGIVEKRVEELAHDAARLGRHALHLVVLVHMFAQERLQRVIELARTVAEADQRPWIGSNFGDRAHAGRGEARRRRIDQIGDEVIDHAPQNLVYLPAARERRVLRPHFIVIPLEQRDRQQLFHGDEAGANAVFDVVIVVGDFVGEVGELRLQSGLLTVDEPLAQFPEMNRIVVRTMLQYSFAAFEAQVQSVEIGVVLFELIDHPQGLQIVLEAAEIDHAFIQCVLSGVPERRMPEIMREADRLGQPLVEAQGPRDRARDLCHLERMRQPRPVQIPLVIDENLGLVDQPAKSSRMHDAIAIPLIFRTVGGFRFRMTAPARVLIEGRIGGESAQAKCSATVASSAALAYSPVTMAPPSFSSSTRRTVPASTFLSMCMRSRALAAPMRGASMGNPVFPRISRTRSFTAASISPRRCDKSAAISIPKPTASPCKYVSYAVAASMA